MQKLLIIFSLFIITNLLFAQNIFDKVAILDGIDETNEYLKTNNSDLVLYQTKLITQNAKSGRRVTLYQDNKYIIFRDSLGTVHKKIALTDCTYGEISPDYKHVMLNIGNHPDYPTSFLNQYYDHKGNLLFEQESGYRLHTGVIGIIYNIQNESIQNPMSILNLNGNILNKIGDGMFHAILNAGKDSELDFVIFKFFKEGKCLIAINKNGQIQWKFNIDNKTTADMIKINKYNKKIYVGSSDKIYILNYSGNIVDSYKLRYKYGSFLGISENGEILAALNVKVRRQDNILYIIDVKNNNILSEKKLPNIENTQILQVKVNDNGIVLITYSNGKYFDKTLILLDKNGNILINYNYKKLLTPDMEFEIITTKNGLLLFNGRNSLVLENL